MGEKFRCRLFIGGNAEDGHDFEGELPFTRKDVKKLPDGEARYDCLKGLVDNHASILFAYDNKDGALFMDVQTANLLVSIAGALNARNRAKFLSMDLGAMVDTAWKLVG